MITSTAAPRPRLWRYCAGDGGGQANAGRSTLAQARDNK